MSNVDGYVIQIAEHLKRAQKILGRLREIRSIDLQTVVALSFNLKYADGAATPPDGPLPEVLLDNELIDTEVMIIDLEHTLLRELISQLGTVRELSAQASSYCQQKLDSVSVGQHATGK